MIRARSVVGLGLLVAGCSTAPAQDPEPTKHDLGDYRPRGAEPEEKGLYRNRAYWWMAHIGAKSIMDGHVFHDTSESFARYRFARFDNRGSLVVEVARHPQECVSRKLGLLEHDLKVVLLGLSSPRRIEIYQVKDQWVATALWHEDDPRFAGDETKYTGALVGWLAANHTTVIMEFDGNHEHRPDVLSLPILAAYLDTYPSILKQDFKSFHPGEARRAEADKVRAWNPGSYVFMALTYYPFFHHPHFSARELKAEMPKMEAWWKQNRDRCPEEWRLELADAAVEHLKEVEGEKLFPKHAHILARFGDALSWWVARNALVHEPDGEWTGRYDFWKKWWSQNRGRKLSEQWAALVSGYIDVLATMERVGTEEESKLVRERLRRLEDLISHVDARKEPPGLEGKSPSDPSVQAGMIRAWQDWWKENRATYVNPLVRDDEREYAEQCTCGKHK